MMEMGYTERLAPKISDGFDSYFLTNPVGVFFIDMDGHMHDVNRRACEIFGYASPEEAEGKPLSRLEFFFSHSIIGRIMGLLSTDEPFKLHCFPGTNLQGHFAHYCLSCNQAVNSAGEQVGIFGIIEDVTDQIRPQEELKHRIEELSVLSQISQEVSSAIDTEEVLKVILTGVTARQGLGFNRAFLFLLDDDARTLIGRLAIGPSDAVEAGKIWGPLEKDDRSLIEILSLYQEESERGNRSLTDLISDMRLDVNKGSLFARAVQDRVSIIVENDDQIDRVTEKILDRLGERQVAMTPLVARDRTIGLLMVDNAITHKQITEYDRQFLRLIADQTAAAVERSYLYRDLRERAVELERINRKLAETQNQIIEAEKMSVIGEITSAVAHELRNPLTIIGGFANLMHKSLEPGSSDAEYLNIIISETQRAESVLTDVLDFSKASRVKDRRVNLNDLVRQAYDMLSVRIGNGRCRMRIAPCESELPIWGNPDQLLHACYQIFWTIMHDLSADISPRVTTYGLSEVTRMEICCRPGGMQKEKVEQTLGQYFGGGNNTKRLSLLVAEETLKHHGGSLGVESNPEEGPVLFVQLPLHKETADA